MNVHTLLRNAAGAAPVQTSKADQHGLPMAGAHGGLHSLVETPDGKQDGAKNQKQRQEKAAQGRTAGSASSHLVPQRSNGPSSGG